ncbi:MAG TPA: disulfide bond formation protein DsbA [Agrobacterium sp.]|nr:disulfide bond formation protein DsbA [Agrobacterium sp.]
MNKRAIVVLTAFFAVVIFAGGAALYTSNKTDVPVTASVAAGDSLVRTHSKGIGRADAPVTIVEFFDPSCEACRAFYPHVKEIMARTGDDVRLVMRYTPLNEGSDEVVRILEAARKQGKFEPVLESILAKQPEWAIHGAPDIEKAWQIAAEGGLNLETGRKDAIAPEVDAVLKQDVADMETNKVQQTPTFYVNGKPLTEFSPQGLYNLVRSEVQATKSGS